MSPEPEKSRPHFRRLRELKVQCEQILGAPLPHLSMGMSGDFEVAIEEGATMVRIGTALFGPRASGKDARSGRIEFMLQFVRRMVYLGVMTIETFKREIAEAVKAYERYIVCLDKTPEDFEASLVSLMDKAIKAYENRGEGLRHGIALDKQVTIILSQSDEARPLCGIYFNLHSPYQKSGAAENRQVVQRQTAGIKAAGIQGLLVAHFIAHLGVPVTRSATMSLSRWGPVILTSPTFKPSRYRNSVWSSFGIRPTGKLRTTNRPAAL